MSQWQDQIQANADAIALMLANALEIKDHPVLVAAIDNADKILLQRDADDSTVYATRAQLVGSVFNPTLTGEALGDILVYNGVAWENFAAGTDGYVLSANSGEATGLEWIVDGDKQTLQQVTDEGQTTTDWIRVDKLEIQASTSYIDVVGGQMIFSNNADIKLVDIFHGSYILIDDGYVTINSFGTSTRDARLQTDLLTAARTYDFANVSGIIPMTVNSISPDGVGNIVIPTATMPLTTKGDLFTFNATIPDRLAIGTDGFVLTADSGEDTGMKWASPSASSTAASVNLPVRNSSGGLITKGTGVYDAGWNVGTSEILIDVADADDPAKMPVIGVVSADIANGVSGEIINIGVLENFDTTFGSQGDAVYISTTGTLVNTKPTGTTAIQKVGSILNSNVSTGSILVSGANRSNDLPLMIYHR